jgi:hypothetical protein
LIANELRSRPYLLSSYKPKLLNVKFSAVEKNVHGTKIKKHEAESKTKGEMEWAKINEPSAATYNMNKEEQLHEKKPTWTFPQQP